MPVRAVTPRSDSARPPMPCVVTRRIVIWRKRFVLALRRKSTAMSASAFMNLFALCEKKPT